MMATGLILYLPVFAQLAANRMLWKSIHLGAAIAFWVGLLLLIVGQPHASCERPRARSTASTATTGAGCGGRSAGTGRSRRRAGSTPARS